MMDAKYLAEIKAREQAATPGEWKSGGCPRRIVKDLQSVYREIGCYGGQLDICRDVDPANAAFIAHARADIPALLAVVELSEKANAIGAKQNDELMDKLEDADQQITTLKRALEIASKEVNTAFETLAAHHVITWEQKGGIQDNIDAWIQKAKQAQEQEGKK